MAALARADAVAEIQNELADLGVLARVSNEHGFMLSPMSKIEPELLERVRAHKAYLIHNIVSQVESEQEVTLCRACFLSVRPTEPHLALELEHDVTPRNYHRDPSCVAAMASLVEPRSGEVYQVHQVHAATCPDDEPGYGCSGGCF